MSERQGKNNREGDTININLKQQEEEEEEEDGENLPVHWPVLPWGHTQL